MIQSVLVYFIIAIFIGISQSAGIGGGPILNICLMIGLGFQSKQSTSITYIFLIGGAFASIITNYNKKNVLTGNPVMNSNLILVTLPMIISGSIFGSMLNKFISELIVTILFTILLSYLFWNSLQKYKLSEAVNISIQKKDGDQDKSYKQEIRIIENIVYEQYPLYFQNFFLYSFFITFERYFLYYIGGKNYQSILGIQKCGFYSYCCVVLHLLISLLFSLNLGKKHLNRKKNEDKIYGKSSFMNQSKINLMILSGFIAGLLGGALGLGVWLNSGIEKTEATSSSTPLIFFSALVSYFLALLSHSYKSIESQILYFIIAFIGSYVVKSLVNYLTEKFQLKSMIYILLMLTMGVSLTSLLPFQISKFLIRIILLIFLWKS